MPKEPRYWWSEHLPLGSRGLATGYKRTKFSQSIVFCGKPYARYIDESEQEIDICDSRYSNFGFQKKSFLPRYIPCCDRRKLFSKNLSLCKINFYGRTVECGTLTTLKNLFPQIGFVGFMRMRKNGFLPEPNITYGKTQFYFFEHLQAFAKVYNDLILQGVYHPTVEKYPLHHAWLLKEWEAATKKIYEKPTESDLEVISNIPKKEMLKVVQDVVFE